MLIIAPLCFVVTGRVTSASPDVIPWAGFQSARKLTDFLLSNKQISHTKLQYGKRGVRRTISSPAISATIDLHFHPPTT